MDASGLSSPSPAFNGRASAPLERPKRSLFRPKGVPKSLAGHAKAKYPFLHVHATVLSDAIAVGVNVPHGIVDGMGMGIILKGLTAELHGEEWEVPPAFEGSNPWQAALDRLVDDEPASAAEPGTPASCETPSCASDVKLDLSEKGLSPLGTLSKDAQDRAALPSTGMWRSFSTWPALRLLSSVFVENVFRRNERGWALLNHATVNRLVQRVKAEIKEETGGAEFVSTGDILFAWALKVRRFPILPRSLPAIVRCDTPSVSLATSTLTIRSLPEHRPPTLPSRPQMPASPPAPSGARPLSSAPRSPCTRTTPSPPTS